MESRQSKLYLSRLHYSALGCKPGPAVILEPGRYACSRCTMSLSFFEQFLPNAPIFGGVGHRYSFFFYFNISL